MPTFSITADILSLTVPAPTRADSSLRARSLSRWKIGMDALPRVAFVNACEAGRVCGPVTIAGAKKAESAKHYLKGARDLCRSPDLLKKQCVVGSTQLQTRCLLRPRLFHLPAAYPRIDLASLIQTDPQRFWITGRLSSVYHR